MTGDITFADWRTSSLSFSNGNCAEIGTWRTSSRSTYNGSCLEAGACCHGVAVRDTKDRSGPVLVFSGTTWGRFADRIKAGLPVAAEL